MNTPSGWAGIRAGLLALVIGLNLLMALPSPTRLSQRFLTRPEAQDELADWHQLTVDLGLGLSEDELKALAITWSNRWADVRGMLDAPTHPFRRYLGIRQGWALFARPDTWPQSLYIEIRTGPKDWTLVYQPLDPDHDAMAEQIRFRRVRGVLDGAMRRHANYDNLCRHLAGQILQAHPEADAVRFRMVQTHIGRPDEAVAPESKKLHAFVVLRESP